MVRDNDDVHAPLESLPADAVDEAPDCRVDAGSRRLDFGRIRSVLVSRMIDIAEVQRDHGGLPVRRQGEPAEYCVNAIVVRVAVIEGPPVRGPDAADGRLGAGPEHRAGPAAL